MPTATSSSATAGACSGIAKTRKSRCDALVVATAQIGRLVCDEWLGLWLYSLARAECLRREAVLACDADEPVALPNTDDADSRLTAPAQTRATRARSAQDPGPGTTDVGQPGHTLTKLEW